MNITDEQRDEAFANASPEQKVLYESWDSGAQLNAIAQKHGLVEQDVLSKFIILSGDVILGLHNRTELPSLLTQDLNIQFEQAIKITGDLIDFLDQPVTIPSAPNEPADLASEIAETEAALGATPQEQEGSVSETPKPTPDTPEAPAAAIPTAGMRTMPRDMATVQGGEEPVYTSTQAAILQEVSKHDEQPTPRWNSSS